MIEGVKGTGSRERAVGTSVRVATADEIANWDQLVAAHVDGGDVWRGYGFAEHKRDFVRYRVVCLMVDGVAVTVHEKRIPLLGKLWYLPAQPAELDATGVIGVVQAIAGFARGQGVFMIRIEPRLKSDDARTQQLLDAGLLSVPHEMLPNTSTVVVDISGAPEQVMARFSTRARRWIRRADRDGVTVDRVPATDENCMLLYDLLAATADGRFGIRSYEYQAGIWRRYDASGQGQLFLARFDGQVVAGAFAMKLGTHALYKDGGSIRKTADSSRENGLGAHGVGHAVQWAIIAWAKENGCLRYDMCGTAPAASAEDRDHRSHGITEFKRSFNKEIIDHIGVFDLPLSGWKSTLWRSGLEREANRFSLLLRRDFYY